MIAMDDACNKNNQQIKIATQAFEMILRWNFTPPIDFVISRNAQGDVSFATLQNTRVLTCVLPSAYARYSTILDAQ